MKKHRFFTKKLISLIILAFLAFCLVFFILEPEKVLGPGGLLLDETSRIPNQNDNISSTLLNENSDTLRTLPLNAKVNVPFTSQAPLGIWDALHEDACEEASLIMYQHFLQNNFSLTNENYDQEIKDLVDYETKNGYGLSITLDQLAEIAKSNLRMSNPRIIENPSVEDIKQEIANNRPIIVPAAGKLLKNPNFKNGGPNYHMLVITGYNETSFITNDPGTRNGHDYEYNYSTIVESIHDWDPQNILEGSKRVLVFD